MKHTATLKIPTFNVKIITVITDDVTKEFNRLLKKHTITDLELVGEAEGTIIQVDLGLLYMIIGKQYLSHNTIAHETYHIVHKVISDRGLSDEETSAWLTGHIIEFVYKFLDKKKLLITHG